MCPEDSPNSASEEEQRDGEFDDVRDIPQGEAVHRDLPENARVAWPLSFIDRYCHLCFGVVVLSMLIAVLLSGQEDTLTREDFRTVLDTVARAHAAISENDRAQLNGAADRWFDSSSSDPVIVIVYESDLSSRLLVEFTTATSEFLRQETAVVRATSDMERASLHDIFESTLKGESKSTIGLGEVEKLSWNAPLVLHGFAETGQFPASKALIWLQVSRNESYRGLSCDAAIERTLIDSWTKSGGKEENIRAIISRILQFTRMQQLLLLLSCVGFSAGGMISWASCQLSECCDEPYIKPDFKQMAKELDEAVFGQHIVHETVITATQAHFDYHPSKPLVLSFNGVTGTGKNHVAGIIAKNIYQKGLLSSHVYQINSITDYPDKKLVNEYMVTLQKRVFDAVSRCGRSFFIFDEVDQLPEQLLDAIKPFLDYKSNVNGVDFRKAIFIFLSNHGGDSIANETVAHRANHKPRKALTLEHLEKFVTEDIYYNEGGLKNSHIISKNLIDHFVPFLPLERQHVRKCIEVYLRGQHISAAKDEELKDVIMNKLQYFPDHDPAFSTSGCKRLEQKAVLAIAKWKAKMNKRSENAGKKQNSDL